MIARFIIWLGNRGWFQHQGLRGFQPRWWPQAYVEYHDTEDFDAAHYGGCRFTHDMAVGNACDYAKMFSGTVHLVGTGPRGK